MKETRVLLQGDNGIYDAPVPHPEQVCDCGHPRKAHWFRCRAQIGTHTWSGFPTRCDCTKFTNPGTTARALHPSSECPCSACFLNPEFK